MNREHSFKQRVIGLAIFTATLSLLATPALAIVFSDGDFIPSEWVSQTFLTQTSTATSSTLVGSGNPPDSRLIYLYSSTGFLQPIGKSMIVEMKTTAVVTPATIGGITQVDYAEDHFCVCIGGGMLWGPAVEQGGVYYIVPGNSMPNSSSLPWTYETLTGLTAVDFEQIDINAVTLTIPSSHPDFSAAGSPITFGHVRAKAFVAHTSSYLDNWNVTITEGVVADEHRSWGTVKGMYR